MRFETFNMRSEEGAVEVELRPGVAPLLPAVATYDLGTSGQVDFQVRMYLVPDGDRCVVSELRVTRQGGELITGTVLRQLPLQRLMANALSEWVEMYAVVPPPYNTVLDYFKEEDAERVRAAGPTPESLKVLAVIYDAAEVIGASPVKAVCDRLGLPRPTATRWVAKARELGVLNGQPDAPA